MNNFIQVDGMGIIWASNGDGSMRIITRSEYDILMRLWKLESTKNRKDTEG